MWWRCCSLQAKCREENRIMNFPKALLGRPGCWRKNSFGESGFQINSHCILLLDRFYGKESSLGNSMTKSTEQLIFVFLEE
jgi:hypothetical protein